MQNRYAGDVGDFSKLGMLRQISLKGLKVGVNWYLVSDEIHNNDGKHIRYFTEARFDGCDDKLRDSLFDVVGKERTVSLLESQKLIDRAVYYNKLLLPAGTIGFSRTEWHKEAMKQLVETDIVFLDPDNGILTKSVSSQSRKSIKYVFPDEIADYYTAGHSVIIYNHRCRQNETEYLRRFDWIHKTPSLATAQISGLKFNRGTTRDYIFVVQPKHSVLVSSAVDTIIGSPWSGHFARLAL